MASKVKRVDYGDGRHGVSFLCPGCKNHHVLPVDGGNHPMWEWNGSLDKPTLSPSILNRSGHYIGDRGVGENDECWCTYNAKHPEQECSFTCGVCHSFVRDGRIEFLSDCTHELAGQTVELFDLDEE